MEYTPSSPLASAGMCLRILRRLLDDESAALLQLAYLVENIHNPIFLACEPVYRRHLPELPPTLSAATVRVLHQRAANAQAMANGGVSDGGGTPRLLPPQPAVVKPAASAAPAGAASRRALGKGRKASDGSGKTAAAGEAPAAPRVLGFTEYWELFSNLPTLYNAQLALIQKLEAAVCAVTALLDRLQGEWEEAEEAADVATSASGDGGGALGSAAPDNLRAGGHPTLGEDGAGRPGVASNARPPDGLGSMLPAPLPSSQLQSPRAVHTSTQGSPLLTSLDESAYTTLGNIIVGFFSSDEVGRFLAEHTMYTVNYSGKAAPKLLEVSRLWRRSGAGGGANGTSPTASGGTGAVSTAQAFAALAPAERELLFRYSGLLDFLLRSFGRSGVPADSRLRMVSLPGLRTESADRAAAGAPVAGDATDGDGYLPNPPPPAGVGAGTVRGHMANDTSATGGAGTGAVGASVTGKKSFHGARPSGGSLPPLPAHWKGFHTILVLLATPLPCLRRLNHVARCMVESHALLPSSARQLQASFLASADAQLAEEMTSTMEGLAQHDVRTIMSLIDDSASAVIVGADGATTAGEGGASLLALFRNHDGTRLLVHYGRLSKRAGRGKHERLMFLFTDWICYVEELNNGRMRLRGAMPLDTLRVIDVADSPALDVVNCFELINAQTKRLIFFASTPEQKRQWVDAIRFAVRQLSRTQLRAKLASTSASANGGGAAVITAAARSLFHRMGPATTFAPLPHHSRLCRQRRYDHAWQDHVDAQAAHMSVSRLASPQVSLGTSVAPLSGGPASQLPPSAAAPPPPPSPAAGESVGGPGAAQTLSPAASTFAAAEVVGYGSASGVPSHHSRSSSYGPARSAHAHRQPEYGVAPWAWSSSTGRRQRGPQDPTTRTATPHATAVDLGTHARHSSGDSGGSTDLASAHRGRQLSVPAGAVLPHPPSRAESLGGASSASRPLFPSTPLRRPVSERFEAGPALVVDAVLTGTGGARAVLPPGTTPPRAPLSSAHPSPRTWQAGPAGAGERPGLVDKEAAAREAGVGSDGSSLLLSGGEGGRDVPRAPPSPTTGGGGGSGDFDADVAADLLDDFSSLDGLEVRSGAEGALDASSATSESVVGLTRNVNETTSVMGDPAPSEDATDVLLAAPPHRQAASPTSLDDVERVTSALRAPRPHHATPMSLVSYASPRPRQDGAAAAPGGAVAAPPQPQQRHVDPSRDLEAILQFDDRTAREGVGSGCSDSSGGGGARPTNDSTAEKDPAPVSAAVDSSLDLDDDEEGR